jgi:hypothetical protein
MQLGSRAQSALKLGKDAVSEPGNSTRELVSIPMTCSSAYHYTSGRKRALRPISKHPRNNIDYVLSSGPSVARPDLVKIVAAAIPEPTRRIAPIFVEEGGYGDILNAVSRTTDRYFHIPASAEEALTPEDLEYLRAKGCFTLPENSGELVKAYFQYVHPTFPVIDAAQFLQHYAITGLKGINLLLLWSMFSVSASYAAASPQKVYKKIYAHRAKYLFDITQENDKIVLVESALLLSFWFEDGEDIKQSWYWSSIAISIAQTLGLHREIKVVAAQTSIAQRSLWRNIWHCCVYRDVWLAFGMGRPLRIQTSDCIAFLPGDGIGCFSDELVLHGKELYSTQEAEGFGESWKTLISLSSVLRDTIISEEWSPPRAEVLRAGLNARNIGFSTDLLKRVHRHLQHHENAATIAMARRGGFDEILLEAADLTTTILQALLDDQTSAYAAPNTIPLLVPAMVIYLGATRSNENLARNGAKEKLAIYSNFLTALEDNYPAASILKGIFRAAQKAVLGGESENKEGDIDLRPVDRPSSRAHRNWSGDEHFSWLAEGLYPS